ncbi:hypothetical protein BV22DRAFT_1128676 [Leucogyrophana mollusca]|uniref:Uncharacterized protein n=1 Tax=Leucogyrophana mollusca TaxID=85980 RepID=A0ACB8BM11_9AGAM|nr:hypothetical protein BV22DRAFT_1128676 [Leucogyrophana mollusca]
MISLNATSYPGFDAASNVGPVDIGAVAVALLFGCLIVQIYIYYSNFADDYRILKMLVFIVTLLELIHLGCAVATMWAVTVTAYGDPLRLAIWPPSAIAIVPVTVIIRILVQSYFTFRLWKLSNSMLLPILCIVLSLIASGTGFAVGGTASEMTNLASYYVTQHALIIVCWVIQATADATITLGLVYCLRQKRTLGLSRTSTAIDRLILWTVETGLASSTSAILVLICVSHDMSISKFLTLEHTYVWNALYACFGSIYANALLATLNSRLVMRKNQSEGVYKFENGFQLNPSKGNSTGTILPSVVNDI